ncbi:hypothetical protein [Streptomyces hainanensis]|uniref:Translation initiation factor 2 n=1 Tax=Streptomyces hainanensis TaxID=402648 RepID=A0A4R4TBD3_9ACTN|nr:hypothetical protein [Streptomyces hainanensis]TDC74530.1 hypothetical protein E1283_15370 [Streptomyces hainanensis]
MARTVTATTRLLEVLPAVFDGDPRVEVMFGHDPTSAFRDGVAGLLQSSATRVVPWPPAVDVPCDLVITTTENARFDVTDAPVLVLPHGIGFHKMVPDARGEGRRLSGVVPPSLLEAERSWYAVSHPAQAEQLAAVRPDLAGRGLLIGDPCHDRLLVSRSARSRYRHSLGIDERRGQRLVVVASTWGSQSLIGRHPGLPRRLLAELPLDGYRVAAILHPNVWFGHSPWQVRTLQRNALEAGLLLVPPHAGWQAMLTAADLVIGDHGSLSLYAASLGTPLLLGSFGTESVPDTAMALLGELVPMLDHDKGLLEQIEEELERHRPERYREIVERTFWSPGSTVARLRAAAYQLLRLDEPRSPVRGAVAFPDPVLERRDSMAEVVNGSLAHAAGKWVVEIRRYPAVVAPDRDESDRSFSCLAADSNDLDPAWAESASIVTCEGSVGSVGEASRQVEELLRAYPGCRIAAAAVPDGALLAARDGRWVTARPADGPVPPRLLSAVGYACLRSRLPMAGRFELRAGRWSTEVTLSAWPPP